MTSDELNGIRERYNQELVRMPYAHTDIPKLLDEVERLKSVVKFHVTKDHKAEVCEIMGLKAKLAQAKKALEQEAYLHIPEADTQEYWLQTWLRGNLAVIAKVESVKYVRQMIKDIWE